MPGATLRGSTAPGKGKETPPSCFGSAIGSLRFGRTFAGEPDRIATELAADEAVRAADTILFTVPNQLGVAYNARILATIAEHIAPAIGWTPNGVTAAA